MTAQEEENELLAEDYYCLTIGLSLTFFWGLDNHH